MLVGVWWLRRSYRVVSIVGPSMLPAYADGERVLARRRGARRLRVGDVVVFGADGGRGRTLKVKRVAALPGDTVPDEVAPGGSARVPPGRLVVLGDNRADSLDSRQLGPQHLSSVYGVVLRHLGPSR
ncbi:hypothetical protein AA958_23015 [Streptomyces sp. CNQ-509]|nr:hypothetical protein AA958_23015 [Streptomyces sp. CNQ-509]